jgi:integrase
VLRQYADRLRITTQTCPSQTKLLVVLLGGEAGLRRGETMALEWTDIDFAKRQLTVARCEWKGHVTMPNSVATTKFTIRISRDSKPDGERKLQSFQPLNRLRSARPSLRASSVSIGISRQRSNAIRVLF